MGANRYDNFPQAAPLKVPGNFATVRVFFLATFVLAAAALPQLFQRGQESGHTVGSYSTLWVVLLGSVITLALIELVLIVLLQAGDPGLPKLIEGLLQKLYRLGKWNSLGMIAAWSGYVLVVLYRYQKHFTDFLPQVWLFWLAAGLGAFFLLGIWKKLPFFLALLFVAVLFAGGIKVLGYLPDISAYPFSLEWSEGSRYYYASLPFSRWLYGSQVPLSFLHPSRYLLQSLPFLLPNAGLWVHRFWQVALWVGMSIVTGLVFARRFKLNNFAKTLAVAVWAALFLQQGPVYYHLLVCVILVLVGFDRRRFWKTLIFVVLASAWAGISRVNWIPVPAMIAAVLYLIETPVCETSSLSKRDGKLANWSGYLWPPLVWGIIGVLTAVASQAAYVFVSGREDVSSFGSSFTSDLLWYRLLPSPTYPFGVLPAVLLVSAPLLVLIVGSWLRHRSDWHGLRVLGIAGMLGVMFVGGLLVSTKIGGGSNIHNLDAFSTLLLIAGGSIGLGRFGSETGGPARVWRPWLLTLAIVIIPVIWSINIGDPFVKRDFKQANYDLNKLNGLVQQYAKGGEVLFVTQRQLEVFNLIPGVRMVSDYELLTLTEMSISHNQAYFDQFYRDLQNHRFTLIVANAQQNFIKNPAVDSFAEENNAWVEKVARPVMKYYKEAKFLDTQGIQLLVPR